MKLQRNESVVLGFTILLAVIGLGFGIYSIFNISSTGKVILPSNGIHWHSNLTILINDEQITIPADIGITVGNSIDHQISGMMMSPIHTHDTTGKLHLESRNPSKKPETLTVGYFINNVWGKKFDSECIFDYCTDGNHVLKMFVNGKENKEFDKYFMRDGDIIIIEYN